MTEQRGVWVPLEDGEYENEDGSTLHVEFGGTVLELSRLLRSGGDLNTIDVGDYRLCQLQPAATELTMQDWVNIDTALNKAIVDCMFDGDDVTLALYTKTLDAIKAAGHVDTPAQEANNVE